MFWTRSNLAIMAAAALSGAAAAQPCIPGWESIPDGTNSLLFSMAVYEEGGRSSLFAGGSFNSAGGLPTGRVARWSGTEWSSVGDTVFDNGLVLTMIVFDDGTGSALYIGGSMRIGSAPSPGVACWDGVQWSSVGGGLTGSNAGVASFAMHEGDLYAGGLFWIPAYGEHGPRNLARWTGQAWEPVGGGTNGEVTSMISFDDGSGPQLYIGGQFTTPAASVASWNGFGWTDRSGSWDLVHGWRFAIFDAGEGDRLYVAGRFHLGSGQTAGVLRWDGNDWIFIGETNAVPPALIVWDDGAGPALYMGGGFTTVNGAPLAYIGRWDGTDWSGTGAEVMAAALASDFAVFDDGGGPTLYAGGHFNLGAPTRYLARYMPCGDTCYANCDGSTTEPILTVDDFTCFINAFAAASALPHEKQIDHYANCDGSTVAPVLTVDDFTCFINAFAKGCP